MANMKSRHFRFLNHRWFCGLCLCLFVLPLSAQESLNDIHALEESGALQLVLHLMAQQQPDAKTHIQQWMKWERERLQIYEQTANWKALIDRTRKFPAGVSSEFMLWAKSARARALLAAQHPRAARQVLQGLIWLSSALTRKQNQQWLPQWRRQVIETYLKQGRLEDAYTAEQRYQQDYGVLTQDDRFLRARILLLNNHVNEASELLSKHTKDPQLGMLYLIAQLRGGERTPKKVLQAAFRQLRGKWVDDKLKYRLWAVIAEAARRSDDRYASVNALEHLVALVTPQQLPAGLFKDMDADGLWHAYTEAALQLGNQHQLLIGDDKNWLKYANEMDATDHLKGRALYAFLILRGQQSEVVEQAAKLFLEEIKKLTAADTLIKTLFLHSRHYKTTTQIPLSVRYELVDIALRQSDISLASHIMATMDKPPAGVNQFVWQLRRARILIMGGNIQAGYQVMVKLLVDNRKLDREALDHYIQVVFDLQTLQAHNEAVDLFERVIHYSSDKKLQRELYFWMADSRKAQKNYTEAARWYLKSAMLQDARAMDPWAQAARYQAAAVLAKAGLVDDARKIYQGLLRVTKDKSRLAVLKRELRQLRLATH